MNIYVRSPSADEQRQWTPEAQRIMQGVTDLSCPKEADFISVILDEQLSVVEWINP